MIRGYEIQQSSEQPEAVEIHFDNGPHAPKWVVKMDEITAIKLSVDLDRVVRG